MVGKDQDIPYEILHEILYDRTYDHLKTMFIQNLFNSFIRRNDLGKCNGKNIPKQHALILLWWGQEKDWAPAFEV